MGARPAVPRGWESTFGSNANAIGDGLLPTVARGMQERVQGRSGGRVGSTDYLSDSVAETSGETVVLSGASGFWLTQIQVTFQGHFDGDEVTLRVGNEGGYPDGLSGTKTYRTVGTTAFDDFLLAVTYGPTPLGSASTPSGTVSIYLSAVLLPF